jgi:hypothetical protein
MAFNPLAGRDFHGKQTSINASASEIMLMG